MAFVDLHTVTVTARYTNLDGTPAAGSVSFALAAPLVDHVGNEIIPAGAKTVALSGTGQLSTSLPAGNDPNLVTTGITYAVTETIVGAGQRSYSILLPYTSSTVDLADIAPATPSPGTTYTYTSGSGGGSGGATTLSALTDVSGTSAAATGTYLTKTGSGAFGWGNPGGGSAGITVQNHGTTVASGVTQLDFYGSATATAGTGEVQVTVSDGTVNGVAVTGTPASGQVLTATSATAAHWAAAASGGSGGTTNMTPTGQNPLTGYWHLRDNGGDPTTVADSSAALQTLVNTVNTAGGGTIWLDGKFRINTTVVWKTGVSMMAANPATGGIAAYTTDSAPIRCNVATDGQSATTPLADVSFVAFEIDCSNEVLSNGYSVNAKGIFIQWMTRALFDRLYIHDSYATGLGCDFLIGGSRITDCVVVHCGRGHANGVGLPGSGGGGAGIGIGTSDTTDEEPLVIAGNTCIGNSSTSTTYGIFLEAQTGGAGASAQSSGIRIVNNYVSNSQAGIGDSGCRHTLIANNTIRSCGTQGGIAVDYGSIGVGKPGYDSNIIGNNIYNTSGPGIMCDWSTSGGKVKIADNEISYCNTQGIALKFAAATNVAGVTITDNKIHDNGASGIRAYYPSASTGVLSQAEISRNFVYNNGTAATANDRDGIRLDVPLVDVAVNSNVCFDRQTTKTQGYGIVVDSSTAMLGGGMRDNDVRNNLTGGINLPTTVSATTAVASNMGYAHPAPSAVTLGASPATYTAPDFPTYLFISGGTVTNVTVGGVSVTSATNSLVPLEAEDVVVITYTSTPTVSSRTRA